MWASLSGIVSDQHRRYYEQAERCENTAVSTSSRQVGSKTFLLSCQSFALASAAAALLGVTREAVVTAVCAGGVCRV
jgi:hypothetical protein